MKTGHNKYLCPFCNLKIKQEVKKVTRGSDQVICPKCGNKVSQKTREELRERYN